MSSHKDHAHVAPGAVGVDEDHPTTLKFEILDREHALVRPLGPPRKKVAICGFAASTRMLAPWDDETWEIWGLNQLYRHIPRADRWFDIHRNWREDNVEGTDHPRWLAECGMPIYMVETIPEIPTSLRFPLERAIAEVSNVRYFTSTVAYMLALAIMEGFEELALFGIDLVVGTEYQWQKSCVEFLLGVAHGRGMTVRLPKQSALLHAYHLYGFEKEPAAWPITLSQLERRHAALQKARTAALAKLQTVDGALQDCTHWCKKVNGQPEHNGLSTEMQERHEWLTTRRADLLSELSTVDGALQECGYWGQVADLTVKGATVKLNEDP